MMTSKSKLLNTAQPPSLSCLPPLAPRRLNARGEIAGNCDGAFKPAHALGHDDIDDDVDDGRGGESLEHLEGEFLHLACARGKFHQADGQGDRAVLDDVDEF